MKRIVVFVALKIVEILAIVFGPHYVGKWTHPFSCEFWCETDKFPDATCEPFWLIGLVTILCTTIVMAGLIGLVAANWAWSDKLGGKTDDE